MNFLFYIFIIVGLFSGSLGSQAWALAPAYRADDVAVAELLAEQSLGDDAPLPELSEELKALKAEVVVSVEGMGVIGKFASLSAAPRGNGVAEIGRTGIFFDVPFHHSGRVKRKDGKENELSLNQMVGTDETMYMHEYPYTARSNAFGEDEPVALAEDLRDYREEYFSILEQEGIDTIVSLQKEGKAIRYLFPFWPKVGKRVRFGSDVSIKERERLYGPHYSLFLEKEEIHGEGGGQIITRTMQLENLETGTSRTIVQYMYPGWRDFSAPASIQAVQGLINTIILRRKETGTTDEPGKMAVHCQAGVGRSGTCAYMVQIQEKLAKVRAKARQLDLSDAAQKRVLMRHIDRRLEHMVEDINALRQDRYLAVQQVQQMGFLYKWLFHLRDQMAEGDFSTLDAVLNPDDVKRVEKKDKPVTQKKQRVIEGAKDFVAKPGFPDVPPAEPASFLVKSPSFSPAPISA